MNQTVDHNISERPNQSGADVVSLLKKMQQQLLFLEKKIDILIAQSQDKPFRGKSSPERPFRKRPVSKPFRSSGHSRSHGKGKQEYTGEKDSSQKFYSEYRKRDGNRGSSASKKPFHHKLKKRK